MLNQDFTSGPGGSDDSSGEIWENAGELNVQEMPVNSQNAVHSLKRKFSEDLLSRKTRNWYQCRRCRYHGQFVFLAGGHYQVCPFRNCSCQACRYVSKDTERAGQRMREWRRTRKEKQRLPKNCGGSSSGKVAETSRDESSSDDYAEASTTTKSNQVTTVPPPLYRSPPLATPPTATTGISESFPLNFLHTTAAVQPQRSFVQVMPTVQSFTTTATTPQSNRQLFLQNLLACAPQAPLAEQRRLQAAANQQLTATSAAEVKEETPSPDFQMSAHQSEGSSDIQGSTDGFASGPENTTVTRKEESASLFLEQAFALANGDCRQNLMVLMQEVRDCSLVLRSDGEVRFVSEKEEKSLRLVDLGQVIRVTVEAPPKRTDSEWPKAGGWDSFVTFLRTLMITLFDICSNSAY